MKEKLKYIKKPNTNICHFCSKAYLAGTHEIFEKGALFMVEDTLVGRSWWNNITACPKCLKEQGERQKKRIDEMLEEVKKHETNKRCSRYYFPKKKYLGKCPACGSLATEKEQESCDECGEDLCVMVEDPRQTRKRKKMMKKREKARALALGKSTG